MPIKSEITQKLLTLLGLWLAVPGGHAQTFTTIKSFGNLTSVAGFVPISTLVQGPDGTFYGTASAGEGSVEGGTVFKVQPDGSGFTTLKLFTNSIDGSFPTAGLTLSGGTLYGTTFSGGTSNFGTVFIMNTDGTGYRVLYRFAGAADGAYPSGLILSGGVLYGTTYSGGSSGYGTVFKINTDGAGYSVLYSFAGAPDGAGPRGLTSSGGVLYGTTTRGGSSDDGSVFQVNTDGTGYGVLYSFAGSPDGSEPQGDLTLSGGVLYGMTFVGGTGTSYAAGDGTVFKLNTDGTGYGVLYNFAGTPDGWLPHGGLTLSGGALYGTTEEGGSSNLGTVFKVNIDGTGYAVLKNFAYSDAVGPNATLTLSGRVLYGTTYSGGSSGNGTVFKINTDGAGYSVLYSFAGAPDGAYPSAGLTLSGGVLYGTTQNGGTGTNYYRGAGTVFRVNTDGTGYSVLYNFTGGSDGAWPFGGLSLSGSVLYGTTYHGGISGNGTVFQVNTDGTGFSVIYSFAGSPDGAWPTADLTLSGGVLYGTTSYGGSSSNGTVFKLTTDGIGYAVLKSFGGLNDVNPVGRLTLSGSTLYGTTGSGGSSGNGTVFKINTDGAGYSVLKYFGGLNGANPGAGLALVGSVLYGMTDSGGSSGNGTVFMMNTDGTGFTVVKNFTGRDGANPGGLVLSNNALYGTTGGGGSLGDGTLFSISFEPRLALSLSATNVILAWPTNYAGFDYTGYRLESTTNLTSPSFWTTNPIAPVIVNGQNTVTNPISGTQQFFRLSQ